MKLTSKELKRQAREALTGHYGLLMMAFVITELIILIVNSPFQIFLQKNPSNFQMVVSLLASIIISLLSSVLNCGILYIHLNLARGKETKLSDVFYFFTRRPDRIILTGLMLMGILAAAMLPAILFSIFAIMLDTTPVYILTGIVWIASFIAVLILSLTYHLVYYLLIERQDGQLTDIFRESRTLMSGNKGRAFYISLSFIGMTCLCLFSLGIGLLWVNPYMSQTHVRFYQNIIKEI